MDLKRRIVELEARMSAHVEDIPPELSHLPREERQRIIQKERLRGMERELFQCRGTPSHCWPFDDRQIGVAVQIILDEAYGEVPSPFDQVLTDSDRQEIEQTVRREMRQSHLSLGEALAESELPVEPIRDHGRLIRQCRDATERREPWYGPSL